MLQPSLYSAALLLSLSLMVSVVVPGTVAMDGGDTVNDTYLKAFSQSSGVQSYGEVADLLIAWYFRTK